jgi:hypothetical protein
MDVYLLMNLHSSSSSSSSVHEFRPTNDLFRPGDCIRLLVALMDVQFSLLYL